MTQTLAIGEIERRAIRGIGWAGLETWGSQLLKFFIYIVLARLVGPEAFGLIALASVFISFIEILVHQGFGLALIQRKDPEPSYIDTAFWLNIIAGILFAIGTMAFAPLIARLFGDPELERVLRYLSLAFVLVGCSRVPQALLTRSMEFKALAVRSLVAAACGGLVGIVLAYHGWGVWSLVAQQLISSAVGLIVLWTAVPWRPRFQASATHARTLYSFALSILGNNILWFFCQRFDQTVVGYYFGNVSLGAYALAAKTTDMVLSAIVTPVSNVATPAFSHLQNDRKALEASFKQSTQLMSAVCLPAFAGMLALAPDIVPVIFGQKWILAVPYFRAFCIYGMMRGALGLAHPVFIAVGRPGVYLGQFVQLTVFTVIGCLVGALWGAEVVAWALSGALLLHAVIYIFVLSAVSGIRVMTTLRAVGRPVGPALSMALVVECLRRLTLDWFSPIGRLGALVMVGVGLYAVFARRLMPDLMQILRRVREGGSSKASVLED